MKVKISKTELLKAINNVAKGIDNFVPLEALTFIKFEAKNDEVVFTTSNTTISINYAIPVTEIVEVKESGVVLLRFKEFSSIIKNMNCEMVTIATKDNLIKITGNKSRFQLSTVEPDSYPRIDFTANKRIILDCQTLSAAINMSSHAISNLMTKPALTGINLVVEKENMQIQTTDSYRAVKSALKNTKFLIDNNKDENYNFNIVVPGKALVNAIALFKNDEIIELYVEQRYIILRSNALKVKIQLISGGFPDVNRLFKGISENDIIANVDKKTLIEAVNRASIMTESAIKFVFDTDDAIIKTDTQELGDYEESIADILDIKKHDQLTVKLVADNIKAALKTSNSDSLIFGFNKSRKPLFIYDETPTIKRTQIIMPLV